MTTKRMRELLKNAVKCFRENRSPFTWQELSEHAVTADECYELSDKIADAVEFYLGVEDEDD